MAILILNRFIGESVPFATLLSSLPEEELLLLTETSNGFGENFAYLEQFDHYKSNANVELRAIELSKIFDIRYVVATSESDLIRAALIRERLGVPGQNLSSAVAFRDKVVMKQYAGKVVEVPAYESISHSLDVLDFVSREGFPVVIKPKTGAGSIDTHVIRNDHELSKLLQSGLLDGYEIEKFIEGQMYIVDGYYAEGALTLYWCSRYINDCLSFHHGKQASVVQLSRCQPLYPRLRDFAVQVLGALPTPAQTPFHLEVFHTPDDRLVLCEVASRMGGGAINDLGELTFGYNILHHWIQEQCGIQSRLIEAEKTGEMLYGFVQIPPKQGILAYIPSKLPEPWMVRYRIEAEQGTLYGITQESSDKIAIIIVQGETEAEVISRMDTATEWMEKNCVWKLEEQEIHSIQG